MKRDTNTKHSTCSSKVVNKTIRCPKHLVQFNDSLARAMQYEAYEFPVHISHNICCLNGQTESTYFYIFMTTLNSE